LHFSKHSVTLFISCIQINILELLLSCTIGNTSVDRLEVNIYYDCNVYSDTVLCI